MGQRVDITNTSKHNLPPQRTSFLGREREMLEVKRALAMTRLLTLTGAGGTGKTRLAQEVAKDLVGAYPDGVWLVELARLYASPSWWRRWWPGRSGCASGRVARLAPRSRRSCERRIFCSSWTTAST